MLLAHAIATLTTAPAVTDASMGLPPPPPPNNSSTSTDTSTLPLPADGISQSDPPKPAPEQPNSAAAAAATPGHHALGRTLAIHSVCVAPRFQRQGNGKTLLKAYLQRMEGSGIADRAALLAHEDMVPFYKNNFGFEDRGDSAATFGGGGWREMVSRLLLRGAGTRDGF